MKKNPSINLIQHHYNNAVHTLKKGGLILYPTDTIWGIGCDATNYDAITKIYALKQRQESKRLICLVSDIKMLQYYIESIPEAAYNILKYANTLTTIIYDNPIRVSENLIATDNTLAIRVVASGFCHELIKKFKKPIVSTSANLSGQHTPKTFKEISNQIIKGVDYVVDLPDKKLTSKPSTIIKLGNKGEVKIIRQ